MGKYWFMVLLFLGVTAIGCQGDYTGEDSRAYAEDEAGSEAVNTLVSGSKYRIVTDVMELRDSVEGILLQDYWPDTMLTEEEFAERTGISESMYDCFLAEYQRSEAGVDMLILVKAKEDYVEDVETYLNDYREVLLNIYEKQPMAEAKCFASRIETIGNYVCFVQLGANISDLKDSGREEMVRRCQEENERAIDMMERKIALFED